MSSIVRFKDPRLQAVIRKFGVLGLTLFFLIACLTPLGGSLAQERTISGYVEDATSGERIPNVQLFLPEYQRGTVTNQYGYFSLAISATQIRLIVAHVSYEAQEFVMELQLDTTLNVSLVPRVVSLGDIEVIAPDRGVDNVQMSVHNIDIAQVENIPVLLGEPDVQKVLQLLPGVQSGQEGSSGLYVRGGREDQNLILLDGLPVYNPSHIFGFFSVFPAQALKSVTLLKGGIPARYGGRLSSVVDYTMKEGNLKRFGGEASIGIVSSRGLVEGPIKKDRASFLLSTRRSFLDVLMRPFRDKKEWSTGYFYDAHFKANVIASNRDRLYLSVYGGRDLFTYEYNPDQGPESSERHRIDTGWGNRLAAIRWNRVVNDRVFANVLIGITSYHYALDNVFTSESTDGGTGKSENTWRSGIVDRTAKLDIEYNATSQHYLRFGAEAIWHRVEPGRTRILERDDDGERESVFTQFPTGRLKSGTIATYLEDEVTLGQRIRLNAGLRAMGYFVDENTYWALEPRLNASLKLSRYTAIKMSASTINQYIHLLTDGGTRLPNDLWIPSTDRIRPQFGQQVATGFVWSALNGSYEFSVEAYWRRMENLLEYEQNANALTSAVYNWAELVETGSGRAYGLEMFAQKKTGRWTGWLGYTLAWTTRQFEKLNDGETFPDSYDRRHDISLVGQYQIRDGIKLAATWVYGSGYPTWLPVARYLGDDFANTFEYPTVWVDFGALNSSRAPAYHRLDFNVSFERTRSWAVRTFSVGVYNAYGRRNPFYVYAKRYGVDASSHLYTTPLEIRTVSVFQWVPSLSYQLTF